MLAYLLQVYIINLFLLEESFFTLLCSYINLFVLFILGASLRLQLTSPDEFKNITPEKAFGGFALCCLGIFSFSNTLILILLILIFIFLSVILYCIQFYGIILLKAIYGKCISTHTYGYLYSYNKFNTLFFYFLFYFICEPQKK